MSSSRKRSVSSGSQAGGGPPLPSQKTTLFAWATTRRTLTSSTTKTKANAVAALRAADGSAFYTCPLCGQGFPLTVQSHVDACQGDREPRQKIRPAVDKACGATQMHLPQRFPGAAVAGVSASSIVSQPCPLLSSHPSFQAAAAPPSPPCPIGVKRKNAFDILKRAVTVQYRKEIFTLTRNAEDSTLDWTWDAHTSAHSQPSTKTMPPVDLRDKQQQEYWWEKEIVLPGSKTARLLLRTNIAPLQPFCSSSLSTSFSQNHHQRHHLPLPDIPLSVLKSALQKNIRRSRGEATAKVGLQLLHRAPLELYRRLPIIMLEDGICHPPALVVFTWLMMAGERYKPDAALRKVLVRMLYEIATGKYTDFSRSLYHQILDPLPDVDDAILAEKGGEEERREEDLSSRECQLLLRCMVARRHYGGMACDAHMLRNLAKLWRVRFAVQDKDNEEEEEEMGKRSNKIISLVNTPVLSAAPPPSWQWPSFGSATTNNNKSSDHGLFSLLSLTSLDYVSKKKLRQYLDSPRPWCRWLIWQIQAHGRPLPQSWLPSLVTNPGEMMADAADLVLPAAVPPASSSATASAVAVAPPLENWPAVWRLNIASGGENEEDIPWSAIDFHVSGVVDEIYQSRLSSEEKRRMACVGRLGRNKAGEEGREEFEDEVVKALLRSAMWRFSSSVTNKFSVLLPAQEENKRLLWTPHQQDFQDHKEEVLREAWDLMRPLAHAFAQSFIKRRYANLNRMQ